MAILLSTVLARGLSTARAMEYQNVVGKGHSPCAELLVRRAVIEPRDLHRLVGRRFGQTRQSGTGCPEDGTASKGTDQGGSDFDKVPAKAAACDEVQLADVQF